MVANVNSWGTVLEKHNVSDTVSTGGDMFTTFSLFRPERFLSCVVGLRADILKAYFSAVFEQRGPCDDTPCSTQCASNVNGGSYSQPVPSSRESIRGTVLNSQRDRPGLADDMPAAQCCWPVLVLAYPQEKRSLFNVHSWPKWPHGRTGFIRFQSSVANMLLSGTTILNAVVYGFSPGKP